ncbi:MAG: hypothetical protein QTN59_01915 [Candidatus Electrothrix communis]|nr:MAG: hypothetical protein QTN59_01915 [Candidatus Electrothrix communis]
MEFLGASSFITAILSAFIISLFIAVPLYIYKIDIEQQEKIDIEKFNYRNYIKQFEQTERIASKIHYFLDRFEAQKEKIKKKEEEIKSLENTERQLYRDREAKIQLLEEEKKALHRIVIDSQSDIDEISSFALNLKKREDRFSFNEFFLGVGASMLATVIMNAFKFFDKKTRDKAMLLLLHLREYLRLKN